MTATATENVYILNERFYFPSLGRHRRLWVYLPIGYETSRMNYPVIYMHDGQNLFDELNDFGNEWGIDEVLDAERGNIIVVGIDNGEEHRMAEYMLHDHPDHGAGEGALYLKDIAEVLKPFVDSVLRTRPGNEHTCIAGSSMGGLISLYAGLYFPHLFGVVGIFSPAIWLDAPKIFTEVNDVLAKHVATGKAVLPQRWYFYAGAIESETMVAEVATMVKILRQYPHLDITYQIDAKGVHEETVWKSYFPEFYKWVVGIKPAKVLEQESDIKID
jgi:predicted alpha/beta superfamily hydrolase